MEQAAASGWITRGRRALMVEPAPRHVQGALTRIQYQRLDAALPPLCVLAAAMTVAVVVARPAGVPWWELLGPASILVTACLALLLRRRGKRVAVGPEGMRAFLDRAPRLAAGLGALAGVWGLAIMDGGSLPATAIVAATALVAASCLASVPAAALGAICGALAPVMLGLALSPDRGAVALAAVLALAAMVQARMVIARFEETVQALLLQHELNRLASSDPLTSLDNRPTFDARLAELLEGSEPVLIALADLDGFKAVNDTHGHLAGDAVLVEVARRMRAAAPSALSLARFGGDEFAFIFAAGTRRCQAEVELEALRSAVASPYPVEGRTVAIETSLGIAYGIETGADTTALLRLADNRLYADKIARGALRRAGQLVAVPTRPAPTERTAVAA